MSTSRNYFQHYFQAQGVEWKQDYEYINLDH